MRSVLVSSTGGHTSARAQTSTDRVHVEHILAVARVAMCLACVTASWMGAVSAPAFLGFVRILLLTYTGLSLLFLGIFSYSPPARLGADRAIHAGDFAWAAILVLISG